MVCVCAEKPREEIVFFCDITGWNGKNLIHYLQVLRVIFFFFLFARIFNVPLFCVFFLFICSSLGVDLSILPRFRWVQFRLDTEPMRGLLARHFLRRIFNVYHGCLPSPDDPVFRAIEWIVCIGQRLNDSLSKFGIPEVVQGPCMFFKCPLEKQDHKVILE